MKKTTARLSKAMRETVDVDGLSEKIFGKYMKFIDTKVRAPGLHISPVGKKKVEIPKEPKREEEGDFLLEQNLGSNVHGTKTDKSPTA